MHFKQISVVLGLSLLWLSLSAQLNYIDIQPDIRLEGVDHLPLDLDNNGSTDFMLIHDTVLANWPNEGSQINVIHHMGINEIVGELNGHFFPKALYFNALLNEQSKSWGMMEDNLALYVWVITNGVMSHHGNWRFLTNDRFVGFRMETDVGRVYGWIRLFVSPDGSYMIFKDYAYMEMPEMPIYTGEGIPAIPVQDIVVEDVFDFGDGRDLQVKFSPPENELVLSHYRVMFVKSSEVQGFDLMAAQQVPAGSFTKVFPGQPNYLLQLNENTADVNGESIRAGESYVAYVLSVGKCLNNPAYALSQPSTEIKLVEASSVG
ncbi:hypothetical protein ACFLRI_05260, partial [Bacteroidota bacterium]